MNESWVRIEEPDVNKAKEKNVQGTTLSMKLSSFDIPHEARSKFDSSAGVLHVTFYYADGGEKYDKVVVINDGLKVTTGKRSKRLYEIELDVSARLSLDCWPLKVQLELEQAEESLVAYSKTHPSARAQSFEAVKNVLAKYGRNLIPSEFDDPITATL